MRKSWRVLSGIFYLISIAYIQAATPFGAIYYYHYATKLKMAATGYVGAGILPVFLLLISGYGIYEMIFLQNRYIVSTAKIVIPVIIMALAAQM